MSESVCECVHVWVTCTYTHLTSKDKHHYISAWYANNTLEEYLLLKWELEGFMALLLTTLKLISDIAEGMQPKKVLILYAT